MGAISPLFVVVLTIIIEVIGGGLLFPVLPYLVEQYSSNAFTIGLLAASFAIAQFFAAPVLGAISDRYGRRPIIILCTFGTAVAFFLFGLANALWVMFVAQITNGLTGGVVSTAQAYIADVSKSPEDRTQNFGLIGAAAGIGFIFGPLMGGILGSIDLRLPVFVAGGVAVCNGIMAYCVLPESLKERNTVPLSFQDFNPIRQLADLFGRANLRSLLGGYLAFFMAFAGFTNVFVVLVRDRYGWGPVESGAILVFVGVVASIVQGGLIRKLLPRFGEMRLLLVGMSMVSLALILVTISPRGYFLYGTQALFAFGIGIASPSLRGLLANNVADDEQGKLSGGTQSLSSVTQILGPLAAGWTYDNWGQVSPMLAGTVLVLVAIALIGGQTIRKYRVSASV
ncbi:MAG: MFS transporter [Cyanobacteria bacterium P01_E01_bin.34]